MKIFLDTADVPTILKHFETGLIDGVTTNPTLIRKGGKDPEEVYEEIMDIGLRDISMEVVGTGEEMVAEGKRLAKKFGDCCTILDRSPYLISTLKKLLKSKLKLLHRISGKNN